MTPDFWNQLPKGAVPDLNVPLFQTGHETAQQIAAGLMIVARMVKRDLSGHLGEEITCWMRAKDTTPDYPLAWWASLRDGRRVGVSIVTHGDHHHMLIGTPEQIEQMCGTIQGALHN